MCAGRPFQCLLQGYASLTLICTAVLACMMIFLAQDENKAALSRKVIEDVMERNKLKVLGWRKVPVKPGLLHLLALWLQIRSRWF
jgi:hypothetical protein